MTLLKNLEKYIKHLIIFPTPTNYNKYIFYPVFTTQKELIDQLYRLTWYLPKRNGVIITMYYFGFELSNNSIISEKLRPEYMHTKPLNMVGIRFKKKEHIFLVLLRNIFTHGIILKWRIRQKPILPLRVFGKILVVDHTIKDYKSDINYVSLSMKSQGCSALNEIQKLSKNIFEKRVLDLKDKYKKTYIFGRGPSLEKSLLLDFSDGARIVCNQIVNNHDLMNIINPDIIIAGDHCWNMGCSKLSDYFRRDTINWIKDKDTLLVLPIDSYQLIINHFPELQKNLVGIPYGAESHNFNLLNKFNTMGSLGVFFEFLFPLACTISNEILMLGFDGYNKNKERKNNKVPFTHYKPSEYPDEIVATVHDSRPGYYDRSMNEFRLNYDNMFIEIINAAIKNNIKVNTLAPSYHTALNGRYIHD